MVGLPISLNEPTRDALLTRLCALSEIADALKRAHDGDVAAAAAWMRRPNAASAFMGRAPLEALLADGARGIGRVLTHALDLAEAAPPDSARRNID